MLRITVNQVHEKITTLKLEGRLTSAWVSEPEDAWRAAVSDGTGRDFCIELPL